MFDRLRSLYLVVLSAAILFASALPLRAADEAASSDGKSYVLLYTLVVLTIALGLMAVLRPVGRETEMRFRKDEE